MKKFLPLLVLFLSTCSLTAQEKSNTWSMGLYMTPQNLNYSSPAYKKGTYDPIFSYSIGLAVDYRLNKRWAINTGFVFQNGRERLNWSELRWGSQHDGNGGFDPTLPSGEKPVKSIVEDFRIEIPITVKYYLSTAKKRLYGRLGIQPEKLIASRSVSEKTENGSIVKTKNTSFNVPNRLTTSFIVGFGLELDLGERISVFAEPEWKMNIFKSNGIFDSRKHLLGLRIGATWRINDL